MSINILDKEIIDKVLFLRNELSITTEEISDSLQIDSSFIRAIESKRRKYNVKHLYIIRNLFLKKSIGTKYENIITMDYFFPKDNEEIVENIITKGDELWKIIYKNLKKLYKK